MTLLHTPTNRTSAQYLRGRGRRPRVAVGLLCLLACIAGCSSSDPPEMTEKQKLGLYFELALRYYNLGDLDRAQDQVQRGLELDPDNERLQLLLGNIYQQQGTSRDILAAEQVFRAHPAKEDFRVNLGLALALERKAAIYHEAARAIRSGERHTDAPDPELRAEELVAGSGAALAEAYTLFTRTLELHTGELSATSGLLRTTALLGKDEESITWGRELIDLLKASNRVRRLQLEDDSIEARSENRLRDSIQANLTAIVKARLQIASLYKKLGQTQLAVDELGAVIEAQPELANAFSRRAQLYFELAQYQRASDSIQRFLKLSSELPFDDRNIREAYTLLRRCKAALAGG